MTTIRDAIVRLLKKKGRNILKYLILSMAANDLKVINKVRLARVILRAEQHIASLPFFYFMTMKCALYFLEYALPPLSWKILPFTKMSLKRRLTYLQEWQSSSFYPKRIIFRVATAVCLGHLYSERQLLATIGYDRAMKSRVSHK